MLSGRCWYAAAFAVLAGCVNLHPRTPSWRAADAKASPAAATPTATPAATAAAPTPTAADADWRVIGQSVEGRPLRVQTLGHGPRRVLWIGGIHGNEREGRIATQELPRVFLESPGAASAVTLTILEDSNPDGSAQDTRGNKNGVDLNRNFPASNFKPHRMFGISPLSQPESRAVHDLILKLKPQLVIVAHSWHDDRFINFDGPAQELAQRFSRLSSYPVRPSEDIAATPGSLGSWVGHLLNTPILTLEYLRGREPWTAWQETRTAILAVVLDQAAVPPPVAKKTGRAGRAAGE